MTADKLCETCRELIVNGENGTFIITPVGVIPAALYIIVIVVLCSFIFGAWYFDSQTKKEGLR
jgi:hypothetical protein